MDCDMLALGDISAILEDIDENHAVSVVKHDYESKVKVKYLGNKQYSYPRKKKLVVIYCMELCTSIK